MPKRSKVDFETILDPPHPAWGGERVKLEGTSLKSPEIQYGLAPPSPASPDYRTLGETGVYFFCAGASAPPRRSPSGQPMYIDKK